MNKRTIVAIIVILLEISIGLILNDWLLTSSMLASTFAMIVPLSYYNPNGPKNKVTSTYASIFPGLGLFYLGDKARGTILGAMFLIDVMGIFTIRYQDTDSGVEYVVLSICTVFILLTITSIVSTSWVARIKGIESVNKDLEFDFKHERAIIIVSTCLFTIVFAALCAIYGQDMQMESIVFYAVLWGALSIANLVLFTKEPTDEAGGNEMI